MEIWFYLLGCLVALICLFLYYYYIEKQYNIWDLVLNILIIMISWFSLPVFFGIFMGYLSSKYGKVIWSRKNVN